MHNKDKEKQVDDLLVNANQSLNFLRTVIDDLILIKESRSLDTQRKLFTAQKNYKTHKAVLINIENLISKRRYPLPENLFNALVNNLRIRIPRIIEEAIELDRLR